MRISLHRLSVLQRWSESHISVVSSSPECTSTTEKTSSWPTGQKSKYISLPPRVTLLVKRHVLLFFPLLGCTRLTESQSPLQILIGSKKRVTNPIEIFPSSINTLRTAGLSHRLPESFGVMGMTENPWPCLMLLDSSA